MAKKPPDLADILKEVKWSKWLEITIPTLSPIITAMAWVGLSKFDKRVQQLNSLVAVAEVIPSVDLGLPKGVVLGALYDKADEATTALLALIETLENIPEAINEQLEALKLLLIREALDPDSPYKPPDDFQWPDITPPEKPPEKDLDDAIKECIDNAVDTLGYGYYIPGVAPAWVLSCLVQKGFSVSLDFVKLKMGMD